jgi:hypothetical protein
LRGDIALASGSFSSRRHKASRSCEAPGFTFDPFFQLGAWTCRIGVVYFVLQAFRIDAGLETALLVAC